MEKITTSTIKGTDKIYVNGILLTRDEAIALVNDILKLLNVSGKYHRLDLSEVIFEKKD